MINKTFKFFIKWLEKNNKDEFKIFEKNKKFYENLLQDSEKLQEFYNLFLIWLNKIDKIKKEHQVEIDYTVQPSDSFIKIENFLKENNFDPSWNLNKQEFRDKWLDLEQKSSWNRHLVNEDKELLDEKELEKLQEVTKLYLEFVQELWKDKRIRKRLMEEIDLDSRLEDLYFSELTEDSIIRIDATSWDNNAIYELDDFPRWIAITYLLDLFKKWQSNWTNKIKNLFENPEKETFVFLIHDEASWACKHEHKEIARLLKEKDWINAEFLTSSEWNEKVENKDWKYYLDWKEIKWVWQHLMVTKEAWDILPDLYESWVKILPNYHFSSHKWIQAILWEKYKELKNRKWYSSLFKKIINKKKKLEEKTILLAESWYFAESIKIENSEQDFSFKWKKYTNLLEFFNDEENKENNFEDVVIKVVWAENAEWVTVFATLSKKQVKQKIKDLMNFINRWLKPWETILLQENKPHTVKEELVYNSKTKTYGLSSWNSINRIFLDWKWNFVSGISQITKASKIEEKNWKKYWYWTAHWMADMVIQSIWK